MTVNKVTVQVIHTKDGRHGIPKYQTEGSAGFDFCAYLDEPLTLHPGERKLVSTGLAMAVPFGFELQVRPRSGAALKQGLGIVNSPGTVDSDYRGDLGVIIINHGASFITINDGDRIAQGVICPVYQAVFDVTDSLSETARGAGGYGSTGK